MSNINTSTVTTATGTITSGSWNGTVIGATYGGTGVNNGASTITLAGNLVTSGANSVTLTSTGATNVTLPTSGTLVNSAVTTLSSLTSVGTLTGLTVSGGVGVGVSNFSGAKLTVSDGSSAAWKLTNVTGVSSLLARNSSDTGYASAIYDATQHIFYESGAEILRMYAGNLSLGAGAAPVEKLDVAGNINIGTGYTYKINSVGVLSSTTLGASVVNSSLTSVGTLTGLNCSGLTVMPPTSQTVANAATIQLSTTVSHNILRPTDDATIAGAIINFAGSPTNGQVCTIVTTAGINVVTGTLNTASLPAVTTLLAGTYLNCVWDASAAKWIVGK